MGLLRLMLALSVIAGHAGAPILGLKWIGAWYAVNAFFIISGFYMAMVLTEKYRTANDNITFYKNRLLRLYPVYIIGVLLAIGINLWRGIGISGGLFGSLNPIGKIYYILSNIFIIGQDFAYLFCIKTLNGTCSSPLISINPPAWSIAVELMFYAAAPFIVRSFPRVIAFTLIGAVYLGIMDRLTYPLYGLNTDFFRDGINREHTQYYFFPASFMYFGLGALSYHLSCAGSWSALKSPVAYIVSIVLLMLVSITNGFMPWVHAVIFAAAIPCIFQLTKSSHIDRAIGDLSYPVYIFHFPLIMGLGYAGYKGEMLSNLTALASVGLGLIALFLVDRPMERYRQLRAKLIDSVGAQALQPSWLGFSHRRAAAAYVSAYILGPYLFIAAAVAGQDSSVLVAYNLTDANWRRGIAIKGRVAKFFITDKEAARSSLYVGDSLVFRKSGERKILEIVPHGMYVNILLEGNPLDPKHDGYPSPIRKVLRN